MANESMRMSTAGINALRQREGVALRYYNDIANNCTYGIGTLVHLGPCSIDELQRPVTEAEVNKQLALDLQTFERLVRDRVTQTSLTQPQFDGLVSFVFNVGPRGSSRVLEAANHGDMKRVAKLMGEFVYVRPRDAKGKPKHPIHSKGLENRRRAESAPFN